MATLAMSGLEKVALLLKRLDPDVVTKVLRFLDPRHAGLVQTQMAKLDSQGDLSQKMAGIVDEAVQILEHDTRTPSAPAAAAKVDGKNQPAKAAVVPERGHGVDIRVGGGARTPASRTPRAGTAANRCQCGPAPRPGRVASRVACVRPQYREPREPPLCS